MKGIFLYSLLLFMFHYCEAQKLEIEYHPTFHLKGRCIVTNNKQSWTMQLEIIDSEDSSKIWWSETRMVPVKYLDEIKRMFEIANHLSSYKSVCMDGIQINGVFESDTLRNEFVFSCLSKGNIQYDFLKQSNKTMLKILKNKKSKGYVRIINEYL